MPTNTMISVIVPTYNHEKYIQTALDSIFAQQTEYSFEVLIGDDFSTDGTRTLLQEYKSRYPDCIRLFLSPQNLGATRNAYNLLTNARGKYLATLEGDDYWTDLQKLQQQVDFLESHPAYVGCTHKFTIVDENNHPLKNQELSWVVQKNTFSLNDFDGILMPGQPSTFVRRNIFLQPDCDYSICYKAHPLIADRTLMLIFLSKGNFYCMDRNMSCYRKAMRKNAANITTQIYRNNSRQIADDVDFLSKLEEYAATELNLNIQFESRKQIIFLESIIKFVRHPRIDEMRAICYVWGNLTHPIGGLLKLPSNLISKLNLHKRYHF